MAHFRMQAVLLRFRLDDERAGFEDPGERCDLSLTVGSPPDTRVDGCAVFVTREAEASALQETLEELRSTLDHAAILPAPASTMGLRVETGVGLVAHVVAGAFPGAGGEALADDVILVPAAGPEEDARPLYLVPFDPSVEQDDEERFLCLRILLARGQAHAASILGRGPAQGTAVLQGHELIDAATYGLAKYWRDSGAREKAAHEILRFVKSALAAMRKPKAPMVTEGSRPKRLEVVSQSGEHRQECAEAVLAHPLPGEPKIAAFVEEELPFADVPDEQPGGTGSAL